MELKKGNNDNLDNIVNYRHRLAKRYLELTKDLYLIDKDLLLTMQTDDLEELGKAMVQPAKLLEEMMAKEKTAFAQTMVEKRRDREKLLMKERQKILDEKINQKKNK
jgi:hypothetical protein